MAYTIAEGKFPKKPEYGNVLEACRKDFRDFKKDDGYRVDEHLHSQIEKNVRVGALNKVLISQRENLQSMRKLIQKGKEDIAFSIFFRTFPSCLPHRARNF